VWVLVHLKVAVSFRSGERSAMPPAGFDFLFKPCQQKCNDRIKNRLIQLRKVKPDLGEKTPDSIGEYER
jgi:hypothetical protein